MAYTRTEWVSGETPLSAGNMNNIEDGIETLNSRILDVVRVVEFKKTNVSIGANSSLSPVTITATAPTGFSFVSIVGWRIDTEGTDSGANSPSCVVTNYWGSTTLNATVRNFASSQAKVTVNLKVLFRRTTL